MRVAARSASSTLPQKDRERLIFAIAKLESLRRLLTGGTTCDSRSASAGNLRDLLFQRSLRPLVRLLVLCKDPLLTFAKVLCLKTHLIYLTQPHVCVPWGSYFNLHGA